MEVNEQLYSVEQTVRDQSTQLTGNQRVPKSEKTSKDIDTDKIPSSEEVQYLRSEFTRTEEVQYLTQQILQR